MKIMNYGSIFQVLLGIWMFASPFVFGFTELTHAALNSMIIGAVVALTGVGAFLFEILHRRDICKLEEVKREAS
jgi:hypothetical protein